MQKWLLASRVLLTFAKVDFTISHIAAVTGAIVIGQTDGVVGQIITDSRNKFTADKSLFVAITGKQNDGHDYLQSLYAQGIRMFMVEVKPSFTFNKKTTWLIVNNSLVALQKLAASHRKDFDYPVVGITGSNGKTIVKEWIYQILHKQINLVRSPKSYNSQIGVPLSVLNMERHHALGVFEAGISDPNEMQVLEEIIQPNIGIFTNIGDAHAKGFNSLEHKISEKLKLFERSKILIFQSDNVKIQPYLQAFAKLNNIKTYTWSFNNSGQIKVKVEQQTDRCILHLTEGEIETTLLVPFADHTSIENVLHVYTLTRVLSIDIEAIQSAFNHLSPIEMRLNLKAGLNNCSVVCDYYNTDLLSLEIALNWTDRQRPDGKKTIILSDIEQSDLSDDALYQKVNDLLNNHKYQNLIGIGNNISAHQDKFIIQEKQFFTSTAHFLENLDTQRFQHETILLKGGRSFHFEYIEKKLQRQVHNTVLEVNMNAMQHNLNYFKGKLHTTTKLMVMVKAYAYGSGGHEIAHFLQYHGVDYLAVAYADEGITLRSDGIKVPIMVMNTDEDSYDKILNANLEPEIFSFKSLKALAHELIKYPTRVCKVHIEFNSGMHRLGFDCEDIDRLIAMLNENSQIKVESIFSHLATSDMPELSTYTQQQIMTFTDFYELLSDGIGHKPLKHILNSTGIIHFSEAQFDMVRLGIGLYGIDPSEMVQEQLQQVGTLWSTISQIREVAANDGISYGKHSSDSKTRKIAVVAIGYADGLNRGLSQGKGFFTIHGISAPIVGNICMDMTMCDVTHIPCNEGDRVQVFGASPTIQQIAEQLETIPYEVLTSISQRVKRVFTEE